MLENFLWEIEPHVAFFLREKQVHSLDEAATFADDYVLNQRLNRSMGKNSLPTTLKPNLISSARLNSNSNPTNTKFVQSPPGAPRACPRIASSDQAAGVPFSAQLVEVDLKCELHKVEAVIGVVEELPIPGFDLLLGNDLCGNRGRVDCPVTSVVPLSHSTTAALELDLSGTFQVCAVTRSLGRVAAFPMMHLSKLFVLDSETNNTSPVLPLDTPQSLIELQGRDEDCNRMFTMAHRHAGPRCAALRPALRHSSQVTLLYATQQLRALYVQSYSGKLHDTTRHAPQRQNCQSRLNTLTSSQAGQAQQAAAILNAPTWHNQHPAALPSQLPRSTPS
ncbi:hypothetical protein E2C01_032753 [Portunus trituberculatus]|uniref:Uncharacterized protein n=1 Tax=Portunus trituberculatus TaxID=210409 RepID=A0A5B7F0G2_PORTR|nr:hypothetical protein [Portunus trituberculatus]